MQIYWLFPALLSLDSTNAMPTLSPTTQVPQPAVEYTFNNDADPTENTGDGVDLDGILFPGIDNGITFLDSIGTDGSAAGSFIGMGCIHIPDSVDVNLESVNDRTISLEFRWDGTTDSSAQPQILFEEGGKTNGINVYLDSFAQSTAKLVMAVWETGSILVSVTVATTGIKSETWYRATLVLERFAPRESKGTLSGYLDGEEIGTQAIDFFAISSHSSDTCLGGAKQDTLIIDEGDLPNEYVGNGLYFHGKIDNFLLFNTVEIQAPSMSPTFSLAPSLSPAPSTSPSRAPSVVPSLSSVPSTSPTRAPSVAPSTHPTQVPSQEPTMSQEPSTHPTTSQVPSQVPSVSPSLMPTVSQVPTLSPSDMPTMSPSSSPTEARFLIVEYTFNSANRTENTGDGDRSPSLDGILFPGINNGITFPGGVGNDGSVAARFAGMGGIKVPERNEGNKNDFDYRTVALDFMWDGTDLADPQVLYEVGKTNTGINMYLGAFAQDTAELVMAVWATEGVSLRRQGFISTSNIKAGTWYNAALVLDRTATVGPIGVLQGFLDGVLFDQQAIDFLDNQPRYSGSCVGGMKDKTLIIDSRGGSTEIDDEYGLYFHGLIDNFRLFNSVQIPTVPPTSTPTTSKAPTLSPSPTTSLSPTQVPTTSPSPTMTPSPTFAPTMIVTPSLAPTPLPTMTSAPTRSFVTEVEYTFNNATGRTQNIGIASPLPYSLSLDGIPYPGKNNGITYEGGVGNDGTVVASFQGTGCLRIPDSVSVNLPEKAVSDRTISLDFQWDGTNANDEPQFLFEEGGKTNGINIYLGSFPPGGDKAELVMAVWETNLNVLETAFVSTIISANTWYHATFVLDRINRPLGTIAGYLGDTEFEKKNINFFGIRAHSSHNCLGGMKFYSRLVPTDGSGASEAVGTDGFYFHGLIDNFWLANSVELPN